MTCDHPNSEWAASYALGALDTQDRKSFEQHLASCDDCRAEVTLFAPVPGLLSRIEVSDLDTAPDPATARSIEIAARSEHLSTHRQLRRWRTGALVTSAAAAVLAIVMLVPRESGDLSPEFAAVITNQAELAEISASPKPWGTEITVELTGLPDREEYALWAIDTEGRWSSAATWEPTKDGTVSLTGATSTQVGRLDRIVVTSTDKGDILVDTRP